MNRQISNFKYIYLKLLKQGVLIILKLQETILTRTITPP